MLQAVVTVHKTVLKVTNIHIFIIIVLLYSLARYYQNRFTIKKNQSTNKKVVKFFRKHSV